MDANRVSGDDLPVRLEPVPRAAHQPAERATAERRGAAPIRGHVALLGPVVLTLCAMVLWLVSLKDLHIQRMNDLGLISVLPVPTMVAIALVIAGFCLLLHGRPPNQPALLLHVLVLIVMLYGIPMFVEQEPHGFVTWRHIGITEYILRTGRVDPGLNAYYDWPGFFILSALITRITGLASMVGLVKWAPVYFNVLYLGPLLMMLNAATRDKRLVWLGVWFFYLTNWISQDSYSPQAFDYFLDLVVLGLLLKYFGTNRKRGGGLWRRWSGLTPVVPLVRRVGRWLTPLDEPSTSQRPWQRVGLMAILMVLYVVSIFSHQLTPFAILAGVVALVVFNRCSARTLPIFMVVALATWISFMAAPYLAGHERDILSGVGSVTHTMSANLISRLHGSVEHAAIVNLRLLFTGVVLGLAGLGAVRRLRQGVLDLSILVLVLAPVPLIGLQAYGGEMLLRIFLFSLPATVFLMAALLYPRPSSGIFWGQPAVVGVTSLLLLCGFLFARYGNERMDYIAASDVSAVQHLYTIAKPRSVLLALSSNLPWQSQDVEQYTYATITVLHPTPAEHWLEQDDISVVLRQMQYSYGSRPVYLIITHSQKAALELFNGFPPGLVNHLQHQLVTSKSLRVIYDNGDAQILVVAHPTHVQHPRPQVHSVA